MRTRYRVARILIFLALVTVVIIYWGRRSIRLATGWSPAIKVGETAQGLNAGFFLYQWQNRILALQPQGDTSMKCLWLDSAEGGAQGTHPWRQVLLTNLPRGYFWGFPAMAQGRDRLFFDFGYMENDQLVMNVLTGRMAAGAPLVNTTEKQWLTSKRALFGKTSSNARLNGPGQRNWPGLGTGVIDGAELCVPYSVSGERQQGNTTYAGQGPYNNGVFHSSDAGLTWQMEPISESHAGVPTICRTRDYYYYFVNSSHELDLSFARKPNEGSAWTALGSVTKTYANRSYLARAEGDTVHVCWLDRRHENWTLDFAHPNRGNYEVAYRQRKDSEPSWRKDIVLSRGARFAYSLSMSVEADTVVVAWAGSKTAHGWPFEGDPSDIYYAVSRDGGKKWARPLKLTDGAEDGITSGRPQVALLNGVIHLFYIQGKWNNRLQVNDQGSWPIYHQQRAVPE